MPLVDCWNTIGVRGNGSCPELAQHVHCQNCPTYSCAAQSLLDREPPADYKAASTAHFAAPRVAAERASESAVIFQIGSEWLALPTSVVSEIAHSRQIHSLPQRRGFLEGVMNVHGELVVCVSLARMLGLADPSEADRKARSNGRSRLVIIKREDVRAVCLVDEIHGIHPFQTQQLQDVPATVGKSASTYTRKILPWNGHAVGLLNDDLLFIALKRSFA
ncbi:MAG: chemotaxis protein CheW [Vicinamibacterales bacterium]